MLSFRSNKGVIFLILWTLLTTISLALGGFIFHYPSDFGVTYGATANIAGAPFGFIMGAVSGLLLGLPQWMLLRHYIKNAKRWIVSTIIGIGIMHSIGDAFPFGQYLLGGTLLSAVVMSVMQKRILRDVLTQPNLWIIVTIIGWVAGYLLGMRLLYASGLLPRAWTPTLGATQHAVFGAVQGVVYAAVTGVIFLWLLPDRTNKSSVKQRKDVAHE